MKRLDLDDVPPKIAALLSELAPGEELLLVQNGAVVARLTGGGEVTGLKPPAPEPEIVPDEHAKEIFEVFRSSIEDEF